MDSDKKYIYEKIQELLLNVSNKFDINFPEIKVEFNLKGTAAGMYCHNCGGTKKRFRFNMDIYKLNRNNMDQTIIHEVAHYVTVEKYGFLKKVKPHGKEWKHVMSMMGGIPKRCHNLKMPKSTKEKFEYYCKCRTVWVSKTLHKRIMFGSNDYYCKICGQNIQKTIRK